VTVGNTVVLVQAAAVLLLVVPLVQRGKWGLLVLQRLLVVVEGERKMWVDHNIEDVRAHVSSRPVAEEGANVRLGGAVEKCENASTGAALERQSAAETNADGFA
jgi:hypothetical protein